MNVQYQHHQHQQHHHSSQCNSMCVLSCEGRNHDISNLIWTSTTTSTTTQMVPPTRLSFSRSVSPLPKTLYPKLCLDDQKEKEDSKCLKEWMSDSDYIYTERRQLPLHLTSTSPNPNRVSFCSEDRNMVIEFPEEEEDPIEEEEDDGNHPLLEIAPGVRVPYIGTAERTRALIKYSTREQRTTVQTTCLGCQASLVCMGNLKFLACVACHSVSPLTNVPAASPDEPKPRGAGIGLLLEEAELLRRRAHC